MKRVFDFIARTNQILLFVTLLGTIAIVGYFSCREFLTGYEPPHVPVAQTTDEEKKAVVTDVSFLGESKGIYLFGIVKPEVAERGLIGMREISSLSSGGSEGQIVNVIFSKGPLVVKTLLKADGLVVDNNVSGQYYSETNFAPYLFLCVTEDTDGNHVLDTRDREDLYVVARDLSKSDIVIKGVSSYSVISPTHLVIKTGTGGNVQFLDVDTESAAQNRIAWK